MCCFKLPLVFTKIPQKHLNQNKLIILANTKGLTLGSMVTDRREREEKEGDLDKETKKERKRVRSPK